MREKMETDKNNLGAKRASYQLHRDLTFFEHGLNEWFYIMTMLSYIYDVIKDISSFVSEKMEAVGKFGNKNNQASIAVLFATFSLICN